MLIDMIPAKELDTYIEETDFSIVDVREPEEYTQRHIKQAVNIPFSKETRSVDEYRWGKNYILYCEHGNLSMIAAGVLMKKGITAKTVSGGISAYRGANLVDSATTHL